MKNYILPIVVLLTLGAGCALSNNVGLQPTSTTSVTPTQTPQQLNTEITYYVSDNADVRTQFCNGNDMDSAGYKNAVHVKMTKVVPGQLTLEQRIMNTLKLGANVEFEKSQYPQVDKTTFANGVVTMRPAGGFAGSSIFMCNWRPFVEKQLEQFPEVKQIKWEAQP